MTQLQWTVNAYALVFASLMLMAGNLADRYGRKRLILIGLVVFCAGSLLALLAPNPDLLIAGRAVMGAGAAASEPGTLSVIRHLYPDPLRRARALGTWAAVSALALATGPVAGGILVGVWSWRAVFAFNLAAGVAVIALAARVLPETADPAIGPLDVRGFLAGSLSLGALTFAVILGESAGYGSAVVVSLFAAGAVGLAGFVSLERFSRSPMVEPRYFAIPPFSGALVVAFAAFFAIFAIFFFTALYLQIVISYSGYRTALAFLPMACCMILGAMVAGRSVGRFGARIPMALGCLVAGAGILLTETVLGTHVDFVALLVTLAIAGLGFGTVVVPVTSVALAVVPQARSGMAASATNTSRELGSVFGVAVLGALVTTRLTAELTHKLKAFGLNAQIRATVINGVENGELQTTNTSRYSHRYGEIVNQVIHAAYGSFRSGLDVALLVAAAGMLAGAAVAVVTLRNGAADAAGELPLSRRDGDRARR